MLTLANAILGQGQLSLAKYLFIVAGEDAPNLDIHDIPAFFKHVLERVDWRRDAHFQTLTTIDTLDYSGSGFNEGSKVVIAAAGEVRRILPKEIGADLTLPQGFGSPHIAAPGILVVKGPEWSADGRQVVEEFCASYDKDASINAWPLIVIADDSEFTARTLNNFLWVTFTRSNPASDVYGIAAATVDKHWGCAGSLVIDARRKPHHAPPLEGDPEVERRVDELAAKGGPLEGLY